MAAEAAAKGKYVPTNWRLLFRDLSESYHLSPTEIGDMTMYQVRYYSLHRDRLKYTRTVHSSSSGASGRRRRMVKSDG
jgi:hypothetical protein